MLIVDAFSATSVNTLVFLKVEEAISLPCSASSATVIVEACEEILQHHDHDVAVGRQHDFHRLRQHHPAHGEPPAHADGLRRLDLSLVDRLDAGAEILRLVGGEAMPSPRIEACSAVNATPKSGITKYR